MNINGLKEPSKLFSIEKKVIFWFHKYCKSQKTLFSIHPSVPLRLKRPLCKNHYNLVLREENIIKLYILKVLSL